MKKALFFLLFVAAFQITLTAQIKYGLPKGALVIETHAVTPNRTLVLWMQNQQNFPRGVEDEIYSCPEYSRGNFYRGITQISLIDSKTRKIINSVKITDYDHGDTFDIPYLIQRYYYKVPTIDIKKEGKPQILALQDINGDGKPYEFALYDAWACMGLNTALFGYSPTQDKVIQYPIELTTDGKKETVYWADYLFSKKPISRGYWKYEIDYRGRAGTLDKYEVRYDTAHETFVGTLSMQK